MGQTVRFVPARHSGADYIRYGPEGVRKLKKLEEAEENKRKPKDSSAEITLDDIILAGLERGLTMSDLRRMQVGQVVDFTIAYNDRQKAAEKAQKRAEKQGNKRKASQNDINAFFG